MSLQQDLARHPPRPLPIALAHVVANVKPGPRAECLNRIYMGLNSADRLRCIAELSACRDAKRAHVEASLS